MSAVVFLFFCVLQVLLTKILEVGPDDVFLDLGHGMGSVCIQAVYTVGCVARGIELVEARHELAERFLGVMAEQHALRASNPAQVSRRATCASVVFLRPLVDLYWPATPSNC